MNVGYDLMEVSAVFVPPILISETGLLAGAVGVAAVAAVDGTAHTARTGGIGGTAAE